MQTCSRCNTLVHDSTMHCPTCNAEMKEFSNTAIALKTFQQNTRVNAVMVVTSEEACPACMAIQGTYTKDEAPALPVEGCSHPQGCRCFYQPLLESIYP
jgi:RNA polymerase subunit RPABC4/transcription elongation factor Spt4